MQWHCWKRKSKYIRKLELNSFQFLFFSLTLWSFKQTKLNSDWLYTFSSIVNMISCRHVKSKGFFQPLKYFHISLNLHALYTEKRGQGASIKILLAPGNYLQVLVQPHWWNVLMFMHMKKITHSNTRPLFYFLTG